MKNIQKIIFVAIILSILSFGSYLFYNQREVSAKEAESKKNLSCDPEIPIGEAMENTANLLDNSINELRSASYQASKEIEAAKKMVELAGQCNINNCHPVCSPEPVQPGYKCNPTTIQVPCPPPAPSSLNTPKHYASLVQAPAPAACYKTIWSTCYPVRCREERCSGQVCSNQQIDNEFNNVKTDFNQIKGLSKRMKRIYKDGKTKAEKNLDKARARFDECTNTNGKAISCPFVYERSLSRKKDCQSLLNFFCCR